MHVLLVFLMEVLDMEKNIGITVKELLNQIEDDIYIKLGSHDGCGFIFCGKVSDLGNISKEYKEQHIAGLKESLERSKIKLSTFEEDWARYRTNREAVYKKEKEKAAPAPFIRKFETLTDFMDYVDEYERPRKYNNIVNRIKKFEDAIENYTDILERPIYDYYPSITINKYGDRELIVIFVGAERGYWWLLEEYEQGYYVNEYGKPVYREKMKEV